MRLSKIQLCFFLIILLWLPQSSEAQEKRIKTRIQITGTTGTIVLGLLAAKEWDFFARNGVDVEFVSMSIPIGLAAMAKGEIQYIGGVGPHTVSATLGGMPTRAVWIHAHRLLSSIVARPEFKKLSDLKGRKIGVIGLGGTTHTSMIMAIQKMGMDPKEFLFVNVPAGDHLRILEAGAIDAVSMDPPGLFYAIRRGFSRVLDVGPLVEMPIGGLTTLQETIDKRRDDARRVIRSVQQAKELMFKSKDQTVQLITRVMKMDRETALESYEPLVNSLSKDGVPDRVGMENLVKAIKLQGRFVEKKVNFEEIADPGLAREVATELGSRTN